jgi:hypothetical protein
MKMDGLDPIGLQYGQEEGGEQRHQVSKDEEEEERLRCRRQSISRRAAVPDAGGAPLAVLALDHLSDGLELATALDARFEQGHHRLQCRFGRPRCSGGPTWCHGTSGRRRIAAGGWKAKGI